LFPFFYVVFVGAKEFKVQELSDTFVTTEALLRKGQENQRELKARRATQEAWFAQNEIVKFRGSKRYEMKPVNLAKATAGLPEYGWLNSFRRCEKIKSQLLTSIAYPYQLFELVKGIVRRMKPLNLDKVETRLRHAVLSDDIDPLLRAWLTPQWAYMKQAFFDCRGKRFNRNELPYRLIGRFVDHIERPKSLLEAELAKRAEADLSLGPSTAI
jgi:hypothetical protein